MAQFLLDGTFDNADEASVRKVDELASSALAEYARRNGRSVQDVLDEAEKSRTPLPEPPSDDE